VIAPISGSARATAASIASASARGDVLDGHDVVETAPQTASLEIIRDGDKPGLRHFQRRPISPIDEHQSFARRRAQRRVDLRADRIGKAPAFSETIFRLHRQIEFF
jgi:hypothetical protein